MTRLAALAIIILAAIGIREFLRLFSTPERVWDEPIYVLEPDPYWVEIWRAA